MLLINYIFFQNGETPLHLACGSCKSDIVKKLINFVKDKQGPEVASTYINMTNEDGESALHYAAKISKKEVTNDLEDKEVVRLLLESGAETSIQSKSVSLLFILNCIISFLLLLFNHCV